MSSPEIPSIDRRAVVDLGSNTFRLVVFDVKSSQTIPGGSWRQTAELYQPVRVGAGASETGELQKSAIERATSAIELFDHYCASHDIATEQIDAVATSAIREAPNRALLLDPATKNTRLRPRVLSHETEAAYGHLAAVNSTTLKDGAVLDIGGGSLQLVRTSSRHPKDSRSWQLGAVKMTERFLPGDGPADSADLLALRKHVRSQLREAKWIDDCGDRLIGVGGAVRNLASAIQHQGRETDLGVQGFLVGRDALGELVDELAASSIKDRKAMLGIKPSRADVILAAAATIHTVLEVCGIDAVEATEYGLREGVFCERHLRDQEFPWFENLRAVSVQNLAARYDSDPPHTAHVQKLALSLFDQLHQLGLHDGNELERDLVSAAAGLHDIGMAIDYDDHHKHGRYLLVSNGLPGYSPAETAVIGQAIRFHRKGVPTLKPFRPITTEADEQRLLRICALLRLAEGIERGHDQAVTAVECSREDGETLKLKLLSGPAGAPVASWAAQGQAEIVRRAFFTDLAVSDA